MPHVFGRTCTCGIGKCCLCTQQTHRTSDTARGSHARAQLLLIHCGSLCARVNAPCALRSAETLLCVWISQTAAASRPKTTALHALHRAEWIHGVAARKAASRVFKRRVGLNFVAGKTQGAETA